VFAQIFASNDALYDILQSKSFDVIYCKEKVDEKRGKLYWEKFDLTSVWDATNTGQKNIVQHSV